MATDKTTIGVTARGREILDHLETLRIFRDQMDAAKLAMSIAISRGFKPGDTPGADTKWNIGSFDKDGSLRTVIPVLFPGVTEPYRAVESLVDTGLSLLDRELPKSANLDVLALLSRANDPSSAVAVRIDAPLPVGATGS